MKFKDYYEVLGVDRGADADAIRKAYRKLAHKYHPDVSSDPDGEAKFKDVAEAYATLKDPEKRAAYDDLGRHRPGEDFVPPQGWESRFGPNDARFDDIDLSDLFEAFTRRGGASSAGRGGRAARPGQDFEVRAPVTLEQVHAATEIDITLSIPETGADGLPHRAPKTFRVRLPRGAEDGQRLRLPGKGGASLGGGPNGDLYVVLAFEPHPLFRVAGRDLHLDLPLAAWEAVLGVTIELPTLGGAVEMKIPPGTQAGRRLRLSGRGLPKPGTDFGDLYAIVRIEVPATTNAREREAYEALQAVSSFDPRARWKGGT